VPTPAEIAAIAATAATEAKAQERKLKIDAARVTCTLLLKTISAVAIAQDPIEEGECGALAPIELVSIGKNPEVALSPPAVVTCDMAVALHNWIKADIQPLAKKHLGGEVIRIETMSSYSCRNAYGRKMSKLSEHGKANALDIRGFVTAKGQTAHVLEDWGLTSGEIRVAAAKAEKEQAERAVAAAKAQAEAVALAAAQAAKAHPPAARSPSEAPSINPIAGASTLIDGLAINGNALMKRPAASDYGLAQPSRLGGPKKRGDDAAKLAPSSAAPHAAYVAGDGVPSTGSSLFLRQAHATACARFGTTLGPEANAAHRNHFHVDLAERKSKSICE
jgi:hypothetical protein